MAEFCIIAEEVMVTGIKLAGLKSCYVANKDNVGEILKRACKEELGIIAITYSLAEHARKEIKNLRKEGTTIVEIPDHRGGGEDTIRKIVKDVIGFELNK